MKPILVFLDKSKDGKYILTKEEIEEISQKAYESGFEDGIKSQKPLYSPTIPDFTVTCKGDNLSGRPESSFGKGISID